MAITVKCPNPACGKAFNLKDELAGKTVRCDACQQPFQVPVAPHVAQPPVASQREARDAEQARRAVTPRREDLPPPVQEKPKPDAPSPKPDPLIGKRLGHYLVESRLGAGGMAEVYRARDAKPTITPPVMTQAHFDEDLKRVVPTK